MKNLVILTGAGMSAESGISTFRDAGGLWDRYPVEQVATPEGYQRDPALVINFYNERRKQLLDVTPNRGRKARKNIRFIWNYFKEKKRTNLFCVSVLQCDGSSWNRI